MIPDGFEGFDRIALTGVRAFGYHGVLPEERRDGQEFIIDVVLHAELREAGRTDDLAHTINYADVAIAISDCITGEPLNLIEALAQRIADRLLAMDRVSMVEVVVHKPSAPIPVPFADVSVSVVRVA